MNDQFEHRRRWPWILLLLGVLLIAIVFGGHWIWSTGAGRRLEYQVARYRAAGDPIELDDFVVMGVADEDNAAIDLRAARSIDWETENAKAFDNLNTALPLTDKEIKTITALVADNKAAVENVDLAMTKKGIDWKIAYKSPAVNILLPDLSQQRELANLIGQQALVMHQNGDEAAALRDLERMQFISRAVGQQPVLVGAYVAIGIDAMANDRIQAFGPDLRIGPPPGASREQIKKLIAVLLDEREAREGFHRGLLGERAIQLDAARCISDGRLSITSLGTPGATPSSGVVGALGYVAKPIALGDGLIMIRHTTGTIEAAQKSDTYPAYAAAAPQPPAEVMNNPFRHAVARIMLPSFERGGQILYRQLTDRRMSAIVLAVALYRADHGGKFPFKLDDLVPAYLPAIPADPMAAAAPIKYIPATTQPVIYSVGQEGRDDGGNENSRTRRKVSSKWDMLDAVQHLNREPRPPSQADTNVSGVDAESLAEPTTQAATQPATQPTTRPSP